MRTWIALFRGINVGGRNKLPMKELVARLGSVGLSDVRTYIQSGNAVFQTVEADPAALAARIGAAIGESHGFEPHVLLLTLEELDAAIASNPFREAEEEPTTLHLSLLASVPANPDLEGIEAVRAEDERFVLDGAVFYLHAPRGIGRSKLAASLERRLGVPATGRNWRSVLKIRELASE